MRTISAAYQAGIESGELQTRLLITITATSGQLFRYTPGIKDIKWDAGSNTYTAFPMEGDSIEYKANFESDSLTLRFPNMEGDLKAAASTNILDGAGIRIVRILNNTTYGATEEIVLFDGTLEVIEEGSELVVECHPIEDALNIKYPRYTWQESCNYALFSTECTLTRASFAYTRTATGGSTLTLIDTVMNGCYAGVFDAATGVLAIGDTITSGGVTSKVVQIVYLTASTGTIWFVQLSGTAYDDNSVLSSSGKSVTLNGDSYLDNSFYQRGELEITSGVCNGHRKMIYNCDGSTLSVLSPFPYAITAGTTYKIYPGCNLSYTICKNKFNNITNFFGFPGVPRTEEIIM